MVKIFLIHGTFGSPEENWFPWLKAELEKLSHNVIVPKFPTPEHQSLENWNKVFDGYESDEGTIFIGHSLGPAFILSLLERMKARACFFVAPFLSFLNNEKFDALNSTFVNRNFKWSIIKQNCKDFFIYHSDNDPYVPLECANQIAEKLGIKVRVIKDAGHFNAAAGYSRFDKLLTAIKSKRDK